MKVPPGFAVTTLAYREFLRETGIEERIGEILSSLEVEETEALQKASEEIRRLIEGAFLPRGIRESTPGDPSKVVIEGSWGLGEAVVSGSVTLDKFVVDKVTMEVSKTISPKTLECVFDAERGKVVQGNSLSRERLHSAEPPRDGLEPEEERARPGEEVGF